MQERPTRDLHFKGPDGGGLEGAMARSSKISEEAGAESMEGNDRA